MRLQFPEGFLLGVSSASAQIEGGEVGSNWNDWYHQGRIKDGSDPAVADDHWNRWREDCALMAGLHLPVARLGVEWARIMPERGQVDESAVAHYRAELEYLRQLGIRPLLCGILVSTLLISVNLVVTVVGMGGSFAGDGALSTIDLGRSVPTILRTKPAAFLPTDFYGFNLRKLVTFFAVALLCKLALDFYLKTKSGLLLRATGGNAQYVTMLAKDALAIGNGCAAVCGALVAQSRGNANQGMGVGMIVIGLASLIIGLSLFGRVRFMKPTTAVILGSVIYQGCLGIATLLGVPSAYNKAIMAVLFTLALVLSGKFKGNGGKKNAFVRTHL